MSDEPIQEMPRSPLPQEETRIIEHDWKPKRGPLIEAPPPPPPIPKEKIRGSLI